MEPSNPFIKKVRQLTVSFSFLFLLIQTATAQNITRIEYFYDTDPGFGLATAATGYTAGTTISAFTFPASISALSSGFHTLYIRSRDANNKWSLTNNQPFVKYATPTGLPSATNIVKMEYFVDTDPGFGLATNVPVTAALNISAMSFSVPLASYSSGFHTLYVRTKDANGKWSITQNYPFVKYAAATGLPSATNIVKMEYFVDTDPGFGIATNVPVTPALNISGMAFNVPLASLANGFHTLYVRTKDADGKWSITNNSPFVKYVAPTGLPAATNIVKMEYFVDVDPGFGLATNVPVTPALNISGMVFSVPLASLANGFHTLYVRSKDADGKWSITINSPFVRYAAPTGPSAAGNIIKMEYFVDTDPGFGNGGNIPFTHSTNVVGLVANIDLTSVANGFHTMYIRSMDTLRKWSLTNYGTFTGGQLQIPTASITVNGSSTFCLGSGTYLSANYSASATYQWKLNTVNIGGATGITYVPTQSGSYTVVVTNTMGSTTSSAVSITVNPVPTATISANGPLSFCQGGSVTLSVNATANATYQWHLNGGNINGATTTSYAASQSGVYDVRVLSNNGCATTSAYDTVTVNPSPSATITAGGNTTFCTGDSVTLYGNTGSGLIYHWSNNATTSSIKVIASGNYSITVTNGSNCSASAAAVAVTVLAAPSATITPNGATTFCNGSSVVLAANTGAGLSYLWSGGAITSSITVSSSGTYYVTVSNAGCSRVSTPVTVTVNPGPVVGITGTSSTVCQGHVDTLTATGATTYAWAGVGLNTYTGATVYATPSLTTIYTVTGTTSGCIGTATFTVNINANNTSVSTTTPTICSGSGAVLNATGAGTYAWSPSGTLSSATGASVTASPLSQTTYTVTGTSGTCTSTATITINVNTTVVPSVTVTTPQTSVCAGTSITFTAAATNGGSSPTFQWYKNGVIQIGTTSTFATSSLANNDSVWCIMTSNALCPLPTSATSNHIHMTVNAVVTPTITIAVDQNPVCVNTAVTFTATITNGGANPVYLWKKNNVTVGSNSATYLLSSPANNDSVWCILTSNALCASPASVTSSKIKMVVNQISAPTVTVSPSQNPICANTTVVFFTTQTNGGSSPSYQWYKNGNTVGFDSDNYTDNALATSDSVWCIMTSNATCASLLIATSNKVVITIAANVTPSVIVSTPQTSVCAGTSITFTAAPTNGGFAPTYQWYKNGVLQAGNTDTYVSVVLNNDSVWCVMTSNALCPVPATGTSNKVHMTVNATVTPTIAIVSSLNTICAGDSVTFTATITNGGVTPIYQWKKNNIDVGNGSSVYGTTTLVAGDSVWCVLTSSAACPSPASVISNKKKIVVNAIVVPTIAVTASQNPICTGASVTFTTSITHGGGSPGYQWYKNNLPVGISSSSYTDNALAEGDSVWCVLTSSAGCASPTIVTSSKVIIAITPTVVPAVSISISSATICSGTTAVFTATPVNGGSATYQWYKNTVLQAGNTNTFTNSGVADGDSVWCVMTSHAQCPSPATAISDTIHMTVNPILVPTVTVTASQSTSCAGDSITFTTVITNGGANPVYQWKKNNGNVGSGLDFYGTTALSNNDSVWCVLTSTALCASPSTITSNKTHMTVNPIVAPTVTVSASANPACEESSVSFTATTSNEGSAPDYQWYKNGNIVGVSSSSYTDNGLVNNDSVWCVLTSNASCASVTVVTSSNVTMTVLPNVVPAVSVSSTDTTLCAGVAVDFTAAATNGGASPSYNWYKNGVLQAGNTGTYTDAALVNSDSVWCVMTSNEACPSPSTANATGVTVTVLQPAHYSFSHSICQGESYPFHSLNLTAGGTYNDTLAASNGCDSITTLTLTVHQLPSPVIAQNGNILSVGAYTSYQWLLNGDTIAGATSQSYTATVSGTYTVQVTDGNGCGNTATAVTVVTGIENVSLVNLMVYPNPTENRLSVRADNLTEVARIELHDDLGRLLFEKEVRGNAIREELDLSSYASGVYLLVIKNSDRTLATRRVFKN